jgi:multidrug efflux system membrane fusion protein
VFPNPKRLLWPNQFVKARLLLKTEHNALVVPAVAVQRGPKGTFVYVAAEDGTAANRPVDVELLIGDQAVLSKGVRPGEQVVVEGQNQLRPGAKVAARPQGSER